MRYGEKFPTDIYIYIYIYFVNGLFLFSMSTRCLIKFPTNILFIVHVLMFTRSLIKFLSDFSKEGDAMVVGVIHYS